MRDMLFTAAEIKKSKAEAFLKVKEYLKAEDVDAQFSGRSGSYYSGDKFIVSWINNWKGIPSESSIDKVDSFYQAYSGSKAVYCTRSLVHEKELGHYATIERALLEVGLKLCPKKEIPDFFDTHVKPYNAKLQKEREEK